MNREDLPKANAECVICGRKYYRCARCIELRNRGIEAWKLKCDSMECFGVHVLLENAKRGNFDENSLKELNSVELSDGREFTAETLAAINALNKNKSEIVAECFEPEFESNVDETVNDNKNAHIDRKIKKRSRNQTKAKNVK